MAQNVVQSQISNIVVLLTTTAGLPATGIAFSAVTCQFRKEGGSFSTKTLSGGNYTEIGLGVYNIQFTAAELDTLGTFTIVVTGAAIAQSTTVAQVVAATQASTAAVVQTCLLTGHVNDPAGIPIYGAGVSCRILGFPSIFNTGLTGVGFSDNVISTKTDANGVFYLSIARLLTVDLFIPTIQYRRTLQVPNLASADIFSQVP